MEEVSPAMRSRWFRTALTGSPVPADEPDEPDEEVSLHPLRHGAGEGNASNSPATVTAWVIGLLARSATSVAIRIGLAVHPFGGTATTARAVERLGYSK